MRILVCNDDGVSAPGLALLADAAATLTPDVWVVGPERKWTAASHQLTFDRDLTLIEAGPQRYACSGAPADCVVGAMGVLFARGPTPDLVLAGINDKRNVGEDLAYSGTTAIAREATLWNIPAIALSRDAAASDPGADLATIGRLLRVLWDHRGDWAGDGHWLSVNLPAVLPAPLARASIGRDKIAAACDVVESGPGRITWRIRRGRPGTVRPGDENAVLRSGQIAVVRHRWMAEGELSVELTGRMNAALA